jgi:hypothetical protein
MIFTTNNPNMTKGEKDVKRTLDKRVDSIIADGELTKILWAASAGAIIEWYDFFVFGNLSGDLAPKVIIVC